MAFLRLIAEFTLAACLLTACGDEVRPVEAMAAPMAATLELAGAPCDVRMHDNGRLIYVIRRENCESGGAHRVELIERFGKRTTRYSIELSADGTSQLKLFANYGMREMVALVEHSWREIPNIDSWQPRDGAGLLVKGEYAYLLGGWLYGPGTSEVWRTRDLLKWEFLGFAPWAGRHGAAWLVHKDRLYVISGDLATDVWSSEDGVDWRLETATAPFGKRYTPNAASLNGFIYVYSGLIWSPDEWCATPDCTAQGYNDVWRSADDGRTWERILDEAPWTGRALIHGSVVHEGEIFLIGGGLKNWDSTVEFTDIWSSSDGQNWTLRSPTLQFPARTHFSVLESSYGCVVSDGSVGAQQNVSNNLYIAQDCVNFVEVPDPPLQRRHASSLAEFNGTLVILGGPPVGGSGTTIWQYVP